MSEWRAEVPAEVESRCDRYVQFLIRELATQANAELDILRARVAELEAHELAVARIVGLYRSAEGRAEEPGHPEEVLDTLRTLKRMACVGEEAAQNAPLQVFFDGTTHVVAESAEEAQALALAMVGERPEDYPTNDFQPLAVDAVIVIHDIDDPPAPAETATVAKWIEKTGKGVLCSREW